MVGVVEVGVLLFVSTEGDVIDDDDDGDSGNGGGGL